MSDSYFEIYKKIHQLYMKDVTKELNHYVNDCKYAKISMMCMIGECECESCPGLNNEYKSWAFDPRAVLYHVETPEEKASFSSLVLSDDDESESEGEMPTCSDLRCECC